MRVAVTGSTGFVGSRFRTWAHEQGWHVTPILRKTDLCEIADLLSRNRVQVILHLASLFVGQHEASQVGDLVQSNIEFGTWVLEAARAAKVTRIINVGTDWQDYQGEAGRPANLYAATKNAFECILRFYQDAYGMMVYHLKLTDTFGVGDTRPKILPKLVSLRAEDRLALSPGFQTLRLTSVTDVVAGLSTAIAQILAEAAPCYRHFGLASDEAVTLRDLVSLVERERGRSLAVEWGLRAYRDREVMQPALLDPPLPGWTSQIPLEAGVRELIRAQDEAGKRT